MAAVSLSHVASAQAISLCDEDTRSRCLAGCGFDSGPTCVSDCNAACPNSKTPGSMGNLNPSNPSAVSTPVNLQAENKQCPDPSDPTVPCGGTPQPPCQKCPAEKICRIPNDCESNNCNTLVTPPKCMGGAVTKGNPAYDFIKRLQAIIYKLLCGAAGLLDVRPSFCM